MPDVVLVNGSIDATDLGITLMHEHLSVNLTPEYRATGLVNDVELMVEEIGLFKEAGGSTIVDVTPAELTSGASPDPGNWRSPETVSEMGYSSRTKSNVETIQRLAAESEINIVLGTGHYRDPYLASGWLDEHSADQIADHMVRDIEEGINGTSARAGIIGEIGADKWFVSAREERSFRAAARAQRKTGLALTTHAARWPVGIAQLDLLREEAVDLSRVIIGHCDSVPIPEYHEEIAKRGAFVQFDLIRGESERQIQRGVDSVVHMVRKGFLDQLLLSHDVCTLSQLKANGGCGYAFIPTIFVERLTLAGLSSEEIQTILVSNPRRALTGE